jgi:hypothetical protein
LDRCPLTDFVLTRIVWGGLAACAACDQPTTPLDVVGMCEHAGGRLMLHPDSYVVWEEERARVSE